jgi:hypothetical protein
MLVVAFDRALQSKRFEFADFRRCNQPVASAVARALAALPQVRNKLQTCVTIQSRRRFAYLGEVPPHRCPAITNTRDATHLRDLVCVFAIPITRFQPLAQALLLGPSAPSGVQGQDIVRSPSAAVKSRPRKCWN